MMKTIIIYATKRGAARMCAEKLSQKIPDSIICDAKASPDIGGYDAVVMGSGVRMGRIYKPLIRFIAKNLETLLEKRTAIFLSNASPDSAAPTIARCIPKRLSDSAISVVSFGGTKPFERTENQDWMLTDNMDALALAIM